MIKYKINFNEYVDFILHNALLFFRALGEVSPDITESVETPIFSALQSSDVRCVQTEAALAMNALAQASPASAAKLLISCVHEAIGSNGKSSNRVSVEVLHIL